MCMLGVSIYDHMPKNRGLVLHHKIYLTTDSWGGGGGGNMKTVIRVFIFVFYYFITQIFQ